MPREKMISFRNRWTVTSVTVTAGIFVVAAGLGFVLLPRLEAGGQVAGIWDSICRAAGLPRPGTPSETITPDYKTSLVKIATAVPRRRDEEAIGRGATLAQQCAICHGPTGVSSADSPNLAGQYAAVIYKELHDFRTGARANAVMSPFAVNLTDQEIADLSNYYAYLPRLPAYHPTPQLPKPNIVIYGAPMRGIAPCGACHGSLDNKTGSPWLEGQSEAYMKAQLQAFASGERRNDISQQMRNIARAMTPQEIEQAAAYYASQPPDIVKAVD